MYSRNPGGKDRAGRRFTFVALETALAQDIIVLSLPAQFIGEFLKVNKKLVNPTALVLDVASVKTRPLADMKRYLPKTCQIIGTHPIFGPGSAGGGIKGLPIVVWPERCDREIFHTLCSLLKQAGLVVIEKSPEEHDRAMAYVLGLTQYIGRALDQIDIHDNGINTPAYNDLLDMRRIQGTDSWELFYSIMRLNPYAKEVAREFRAAFDMLDKQLDDEQINKQGGVA